MNRANYGNVVTNGMQILSVGATTAARTLGRADTALTNLSKDERKSYFKMEADKLRNEINQYETGGKSATQHLSEQELTDYRKKQADDIRKKTYGGEEVSVDTLMEGGVPYLENNSPQVGHIKEKETGDNQWLVRQKQLRKWYNKNIKGKDWLSKKDKTELNQIIRGGNENADV